jgi:hypothetical protein
MQSAPPVYNFADELASPRELGIGRDGSFDGIMRAVSGINYYSDVIGFGESTALAKQNGMAQDPLGIRYFLNTGQVCSNGQPMYEYVDTVPKGALVGKRVAKELQEMGLPTMRGLAPGIMEDAANALNPIPLLDAAVRGGFPRCRQMTAPVGTVRGELKSRVDPANVWITEPVQYKNGVPQQTRWVFDKWLSPEEYETEKATASKGAKEGFLDASKPDPVAAGVVLALLVLGIVLIKST